MGLDLPTKKPIEDIPSMKLFGTSGHEAEVDNSGNIKINGDVSATFPSAQSVQFDSTQNVNISSTSSALSVTFDGTQNVQFPSAQSVQFDSAQNVSAVFPSAQDININGATVTATALSTSGFQAPRVNQTPVSDFTNVTAETTWTTIYTVTSGKTFYLTDVICVNIDSAPTANIKLGVSSTAVLTIGRLDDNVSLDDKIHITFKTPMTFTSETVIQLFQDGSAGSPDTDITLIGWEE